MAKKKNIASKINKRINEKMSLASVLEKYPEAAEIFIKEGLHCIGCAMASYESIEDGCKMHGIDAKKLVKKINKKLK